MNEPTHVDSEPPRKYSPATDADLQAVRQIIVGPEREKLSRLEARLMDPETRAQDISHSLPRAISICEKTDDHFARAITPAVERSVERSVRRDPSVLVEAIFPVLGPAIRKAIAEAFNKLLQGLNQTLEHSFSMQGLRWRLEALRTGKSFAEIVLSHTLVYRVEQVFLIHKKTSLLLQHVQATSITGQDGDMVSSMLSAIQDFVQQSFSVATGDSLNTLQMGDLTVWIEDGPQATLAAVIRGQAPTDLRSVLEDTLEIIHSNFSDPLERFAGDTAPFAMARPLLENCLRLQLSETPRKPSYRTWAFILLVLAGLGAWWVLRLQDNQRWSAYIKRLRSEEGIMVAESAKHWSTFYVTGLRDPLAADPKELLLAAGIKTNQVVSRWEPYESTTPRFIVRRAMKRLSPPPGLSLQSQNGVLYATGVASETWTQSIRRIAAALPGVTEFDTTGLTLEEPSTVPALMQEIEAVSIFFDEDGVEPGAGQEEVLKAEAERIKEVISKATLRGQRAKIMVVGHANSVGPENHNLDLSQKRAESVDQLLKKRGIDPQAFLPPKGVGTSQPLREEKDDNDRAQNRRVSFRVLLEPTTAPNPPR